MRHQLAHESVLRIAAVRDRDESRYVDRVFEQMEAELAAQAAIAIAERPAMDTVYAEDPTTVEIEAAVEYAAEI
jgi:hypothetical protein